MEIIVKLTLLSFALAFTTGCADRAQEQPTKEHIKLKKDDTPWDLIRKESKLDSETLNRNTFHRSNMSDEEYEQLKKEVEPHRKELARYH